MQEATADNPPNFDILSNGRTPRAEVAEDLASAGCRCAKEDDRYDKQSNVDADQGPACLLYTSDAADE